MCMEITSKIVDSFLKQNAKNQKMKKLGEILEIKCPGRIPGDPGRMPGDPAGMPPDAEIEMSDVPVKK